jgi:hypothetical protein
MQYSESGSDEVMAMSDSGDDAPHAPRAKRQRGGGGGAGDLMLAPADDDAGAAADASPGLRATLRELNLRCGGRMRERHMQGCSASCVDGDSSMLCHVCCHDDSC